MKTNLMFKRNVGNGSETFTEVKIVAVDIPGIDSGEGWVLSGHAASIDTSLMEQFVGGCSEAVESSSHQLTHGSKFESDVPGNARLVRTRSKIFITFRKGKTTYNQTTIDSVCIDEYIKNKFFQHCKECFGMNCSRFEFPSSMNEYTCWSKFIDEEYTTQLNRYNKAHL